MHNSQTQEEQGHTPCSGETSSLDSKSVCVQTPVCLQLLLNTFIIVYIKL